MNLKSAIRVLKVFSIISLLAMIGVTGCSTRPNSVSTGGAIGAVAGGGLGAVVCNDIGRGQGRTAAMIGCGLAGAAAGSLLGSSMDELQVRRAQPGQRPPPPPPPQAGTVPPQFYSMPTPTPYAYPAPMPAPMQNPTPFYPNPPTHSQNIYTEYPPSSLTYPVPPR